MSFWLYLLNTACYAGQSGIGKQYAIKGGNPAVFNFSKTAAAALFFGIWCLLSGKGLHLPSLPWALAGGVCLAVSTHAGLMALSCGPMALTSILASMSLVIPFLWGVVLWQEQITILSLSGLLLLIVCILLICYKKQGAVSKKWLLYSLTTTVCNGLFSVIQKYHQLQFPGQFQTDLTFLTMAVVTVLFLPGFLHNRQITPSAGGAFSGILNGLANFTVLLLASWQNASALFPVIAAGNVTAAWLTGAVIFRERIRPIQLLGLGAGIAGVILMQI